MTDYLRGGWTYVMRADPRILGDPKRHARMLEGAQLRGVLICGCWEDETRGHVRVNATHGPRFADAYRDRGLEVGVWGYPHAGWEERFVERMAEALETIGDDFYMLNPEVSYKSGRRRVQHAAQLVQLSLDAITERTGLGVATYGVRKWHKGMPWGVFDGVGIGSPEFYSVPSTVARRECVAWKEDWFSLSPSVPLWDDNAGANLGAYIGAMEDLIDGFVAWKASLLDPIERDAIARWSERLSK